MRALAALILITLGCESAGHAHPDLGPPDLLRPLARCTNVGCDDGIVLSSSPLPLTHDQIDGSSVEVCRNGECYSGRFGSWDSAQAGLGLVLELPVPMRDLGRGAQIT